MQQSFQKSEFIASYKYAASQPDNTQQVQET